MEKSIAAKRVNIVQIKLVREKSILYKERHIRSSQDAHKSNPFTLIELPKKRVQNVLDKFENFYTKDELIEFLSCLEKEDNHKAFAFFRLLSYTGIRKGEALVLTWKDVDINTKNYLLQKQLLEVRIIYSILNQQKLELLVKSRLMKKH
ncbi:hypothetical protein [Psychrobacillus psychrotolerans]|uniref:hypothetical protein n=1 Tax=Psychrobacillus psychrotolerans TaxID=126156 RepID=UPI003B029AD0